MTQERVILDTGPTGFALMTGAPDRSIAFAGQRVDDDTARNLGTDRNGSRVGQPPLWDDRVVVTRARWLIAMGAVIALGTFIGVARTQHTARPHSAPSAKGTPR